MERCDNCLYEYTCNWKCAGDDLKCDKWKPEMPSDLSSVPGGLEKKTSKK